MSLNLYSRREAVADSVDAMDEKHLRWLMKTMLNAPQDQEMDKPLASLEAFLRQTEADYLFQEAILGAKKTLDASYTPYRSYYKDRLVTLLLDASHAAGIPEEGVVFQTLANETEVAFMKFWDGNMSSEEFARKKYRLVDTLSRIVQRVIGHLSVDYFTLNQQSILSSILGVDDLSLV